VEDKPRLIRYCTLAVRWNRGCGAHGVNLPSWGEKHPGRRRIKATASLNVQNVYFIVAPVDDSSTIQSLWTFYGQGTAIDCLQSTVRFGRRQGNWQLRVRGNSQRGGLEIIWTIRFLMVAS
jgi:hypothetical protein